MRLLLRQGLRHHLQHPLQTLLTVLGITAGAALLGAIQLAQSTAEAAFDGAIETIAGRATHTVTGGPTGVPLADYVRLRALFGGRSVAPSVLAVARLRGRGERIVLRVVGVDPLADADLRPWAGAGGGEGLPVAALLTTPGAFVATPALLQRLGISKGEQFELWLGGRNVPCTCVGAVSPPPAVAAGLADVFVVDIATAQEWTGRLDKVDRLDLRLVPDELPAGLDVAAALRAVHETLGPGVRVEAAGAGAGGLAQLARGFRINLTMLSLLSLLVGGFLVHETMRLSVAARRPQFGVLQALGVRCRALGAVVLAEALALGFIGSAVGALLGVVLARWLLGPLVRTWNDHYATFSEPSLDVSPWVLAGVVLAGAAVAGIAGLGPARTAARLSPRDVLVPPRAGRAQRARVPWPSAVIAVVGVLVLQNTGGSLLLAYVGSLLVLGAALGTVPWCFAGLLAAIGRATGSMGPLVRYVVRSTAAARGHLAMPLAAMVLAVATTIGIATLVGSFRDSVAGWLGEVLPGDVYVAVPGGVAERCTPIDPAIVAAVQGAPGIGDCTIYKRTRLRVAASGGAKEIAKEIDDEIEVVGVLPTEAFAASWPLLAGDGPGRGALTRNDGAWVSEPLAFRFGLEVGDTLTVQTPRGPVSLPVAAIFRDYRNERGEVIVGARWLDDRLAVGVTAIGLELAAGSQAAAVVSDLRQRALEAAPQAVSVQATGDVRTESLAIFDRTFAVTGVMRLLCLVVAFFGIYAAFSTLQLERGAEVGLLRCLGARPLHIGGVVLGQTGLLGLATGLMAVPLGAVVGHMLSHVINRVSFGWTLVDVVVPRAAVAEGVGLAFGAALLAGVQPALRFARMRPVDGLREA